MKAAPNPVRPDSYKLEYGESVSFQPHAGPQTAFLACPAFEALYGGALGGGKSYALLFGALRQVSSPHYHALILRRTFPELQELMDEAHAHFQDLGGKHEAAKNRYVWPNGATIQFGYCSTYQEVMQYRGKQFQYIAFDEVGDLADERIWIFLTTRLRTPKDSNLVPMIRGSANPGGPGHGWLKRRFISVCPPDGKVVKVNNGTKEHPAWSTRAFIQAKIHDNPTLLKNDPAYLTRLRALPLVEQEQLLNGRWDVGTGLAFENVTDWSHIRHTPQQPWWRYFGSFDWGYGHKWVFCLYASLPGGRLRLLDSATGRRQIPEVIVDRVRDMLAQHGLKFSHLQYTVAGSDVKIRDEARGANGPSVLEQFFVQGWPLISADNSRIAGYSNMLRYLELREEAHGLESALEIADTPGNRSGVQQLMSLVVDPDSPNDVLKVDVNPMTGEGGDDFYDALRYGLMSRPLASRKPMISDVTPHLSKFNYDKELRKKDLPKGAVHPRSLPDRVRTI